MCGDSSSLVNVAHKMRQHDKPSASAEKQDHGIRACTQLYTKRKAIYHSRTAAITHEPVAHGIKQSPVQSVPEEKRGTCPRARDEVFAEINQFVEEHPAIQLVDFDYRVRQHLHAILGSGGQERLRSALMTIHSATAKKKRQDVKNWPAYIGKLLSKYSDEISQKNRNAREHALAAQAVPASWQNAESGAGSDDAASEEPSEEEVWIETLDKEISDEDQWLNDLAESEPSSPPKESHALPALSQQQAQESQRPWMQPPSLPPQEPPRIQRSALVVLDFSLESWAAWLRSPPQPVTCH